MENLPRCTSTVVFVLSPVRGVRAPCDAYERTVYSTVCRVPRHTGTSSYSSLVRAALYSSSRPEPRAMRTRRPGRCDASTRYVRRVDQVRVTRRPVPWGYEDAYPNLFPCERGLLVDFFLDAPMTRYVDMGEDYLLILFFFASNLAPWWR